MKKSYELIFRDVYGGDGEKRFVEVEEQKLSRKKKTTRTKSDIGIPVESDMDEVQTEIRKAEVQTFRWNGNKVPLMRLGGVHGKIWGALSGARKFLHLLGDSRFKSPKLLEMVTVQPVWVELEPLEEIVTEELTQILNAPGRPMITQKYDVIPKCKCRITLIYPDSIDEQVVELMEQFQTIALLNKRRATVEDMREIN